jgi:hypothetical protein
LRIDDKSVSKQTVGAKSREKKEFASWAVSDTHTLKAPVERHFACAEVAAPFSSSNALMTALM